MKKVAKFEKVSYDVFRSAVLKQDWMKNSIEASSTFLTTDEVIEMMEPVIKDWYDSIKLPVRATVGSAGYDFFSPAQLTVPFGLTSITIPTGIRCKMLDNIVLSIYPRSGLGFKYRMSLDNTVGIIDSDYYYSDNEGHIMIKVHTDTEDIKINKGEAFAQGIFTEYCITEDDAVTATRNGGFGSTSAAR